MARHRSMSDGISDRCWPGLHLPDVRHALGPTADLDGGGQISELRHQTLAGVQALGVVRAGVLTAGQAHDRDAVLERLDHDVAAGRTTLFVVGHRLPRPYPLPLPLDWALGRTVSTL